MSSRRWLSGPFLSRPEDRLKHRRSPIARDDSIQKRLKSLIQHARQGWTYAIFWQVSEVLDSMDPLVLSWFDGYYPEEAGKTTNLRAMPPPCMGEQEQCSRSSRARKQRRLIRGGSSLSLLFVGGAGLLGRAFQTSTAIWVTGNPTLAGLVCSHADEAWKYGIQTLVNFPVEDDVVELGSTSLIFPTSQFDPLDRVKKLFRPRDSTNIEEVIG